VLLIISAEHGAIAGDTKVKSEDQPGDSLEDELTRVRARRLTRAERASDCTGRTPKASAAERHRKAFGPTETRGPLYRLTE